MSKVLVAQYKCESIFKIPDGIDLKDHKWYVRYNVLHIILADDTELDIEPENRDCDFKSPDETSIENEEDYC